MRDNSVAFDTADHSCWQSLKILISYLKSVPVILLFYGKFTFDASTRLGQNQGRGGFLKVSKKAAGVLGFRPTIHAFSRPLVWSWIRFGDLELEPMSKWGACIAGGSFIHYTTMPAPYIVILDIRKSFFFFLTAHIRHSQCSGLCCNASRLIYCEETCYGPFSSFRWLWCTVLRVILSHISGLVTLLWIPNQFPNQLMNKIVYSRPQGSATSDSCSRHICNLT